MTRLLVPAGTPISKARVAGERRRPYLIGGCAKSHNASDGVMPAIGGQSGATGFQVGDLIIACTGRDQAATENASASLTARGYTPAPGNGWWPLFGFSYVPVLAHRYEASGDATSFASNYTATAATITGCVSALGAFRGVGGIQSVGASYVSGAGDLTLPSMPVEKDKSLLVAVVQQHMQNAGIPATPSGWTFVQGATRWYPAVSIWCKDADRGPSGTVFFDDAGALYHGSRVGAAVMFALQPIDRQAA